MKLRVSIDIGGSTTKAAALTPEGKISSLLQIPSSDPVSSAYGILGRFLEEQHLSVEDIGEVILTGQRATFFHRDILGIPTRKADELQAIGRGGLRLSGLSEALVISMGTGTAYVRASLTNGCRHLGGSGVGGGTLTGLASRFFGIEHFEDLAAMAIDGDRSMADLLVSDLQDGAAGLNGDLTAANFGNIKSGATDNDMAAALFNLLYENTGVTATFALLHDTTHDVVLTGSLALHPQCEKTFAVFNRMPDVFHTNFIIPPNASYATAIGALLL